MAWCSVEAQGQFYLLPYWFLYGYETWSLTLREEHMFEVL